MRAKMRAKMRHLMGAENPDSYLCVFAEGIPSKVQV